MFVCFVDALRAAPSQLVFCCSIWHRWWCMVETTSTMDEAAGCLNFYLILATVTRSVGNSCNYETMGLACILSGCKN